MKVANKNRRQASVDYIEALLDYILFDHILLTMTFSLIHSMSSISFTITTSFRHDKYKDMCHSTLYHVNMTTQKVKIVRDKEVIVTAYINGRPQSSGGSLNSRNTTHHRQYQNKQRGKLEANGYKSLNRKAELLKYSHRLRESAKAEAKPSLQSYNPELTSNNQHIPNEIAVNTGKKPKESRFGTCSGCSMPNLCKTLTIFKDDKEMKNKEKRKLTGERGYRIEAFMKIMRLRKMK